MNEATKLFRAIDKAHERFDRVVAQRDRLEDQRDALLEALHNIDKQFDCTNPEKSRRLVREAIALHKGGK